MARKLVVEIVGDTSQLEKSYRSAERGTKRFGQSVEKAGRGAVVASVGFKGLGRAVGFASASFLGGAGIVAAIESTVQAAEESQRVLGQTRNAVLRSGLSWQQYGEHIKAASLATAQLSGFDDEQLLSTFSNLVRRTGDVNRALALNALAANVARGRNISLEQASSLVLKASIGNVGALRRLGIAVGKHATALQALDLLQRKYAGSAAAYGKTAAGAQDRFRVAVQNLQETVGAELLPTITKYLNVAADWLNNTKNQEKITSDLKATVQVLGTALDAATPAMKRFGDAMKVAGDHSSTLGKTLKFLLGLPNIFTVIDRITAGKAVDKVVGHGPGVQTRLGGGVASALDLLAPGYAKPPLAKRPRQGFGYAAPGSSTYRPYVAKPATAAQRNAWFDAMIGRELVDVQDIATVKGQVARLREISGQIKARIAVTKDITRQRNLEDTVKEVARRVRGLQSQQAQNAKDARDKATQARKDREQRARDARQAARELQLDRLDFLLEKTQATKPFEDDLKIEHARIAAIRKQIRAVGVTLNLSRRLFYAQQDLAQTLKDQAAAKGAADPLAGLVQISSKRLAAILAVGTGLGVAGRRTLQANIAGAEIQPLHVHVNIDGREVGRAVTKDQARTGRRTASQTSGRRG